MTVTIGMRRELFVDDWLIDTMQGTRLQLQKPERREVALCMDAAWEDCVAFPDRVLALAKSRDGIVFTRPELGVCEFQGSK